MFVDVTLAGAELPWRFNGGDRLTGWLRERPWSSKGGVLGVHVSGPVHASKVSDYIAGRVREIEGPRVGRDVEVRACIADVPLAEPIEQIRSWLDITPLKGRSEQVRAVSRALADLERVWILDATTVAIDLPWRERLRRQLDEIAKSGPGHRLAVVVVEQRLPDPDSCDLRRGVPSSAGSAGMLATWESYVHHRLAWEAGGDLDLATRRQDAALAIRSGDDTALEACFNREADAAWRSLSEAERTLLLERFSRPLPPGALAAWPIDATCAPFAWTPYGVAEPVAWLSRALLRQARSVVPKRVLRNALVCGPLRDAVMARCLAWEGLLRAANVPTGTPKPETMRAWDDFSRGASSDRIHYPPESPALPQSPWDIAALGEFTHALPFGPAKTLIHDLRVLRNSLMHGHYVSWTTLERADAIGQKVE